MIGIFGDIILDKYVYTSAKRVSPEAPVVCLDFESKEFRLGGAANVALNLQSIGAKCKLFGVIGNDGNGKELEKILNEFKIESFLKKDENIVTTTKERIISQSQQISRIDYETKLNTNSITESDLDCFLKDIKILIISDYNKHLGKHIPLIINYAIEKEIFVITDPKVPNFERYKHSNIITPNKSEFDQFLNFNNFAKLSKENLIINLMNKFDISNIVNTRGKMGVSIYSKNSSEREDIMAEAKSVCDVTGAGDTFLATLAYSIYSGRDIFKSSKIANSCSSLVVSKFGTSVLSKSEFEEIFSIHAKMNNSNIDEIKFSNFAYDRKIRKRVIGFTNGCFDILHIGHIKLFEYAKKHCDFLIVGLNSDQSVNLLKGQGRPINSQINRKEILDSIKYIDEVVIFDELTPENLIKDILPDILIKGSDYEIKDIVGAEIVKSHGGKVLRFSLIKGESTSQKIRDLDNE